MSSEKIPVALMVGYTRKSSEGDDKQARSNDQQRSEIERVFGDIPDNMWFHDHASGRSFLRPAFSRMLQFCRANPQPDDCPGRICIYDITRFGRINNARNEPDVDAMEFMRLSLKQLGWHLAYVNGPSTGHIVGDAVVRTLESEAGARFSSVLSVKVALGKRDWARQGWWNGGRAPFGTRRFNIEQKRILVDVSFDPDTGKKIRGEAGVQGATILVRDSVTAPHLEWAFDRVLEGWTVKAIGRELDKRYPALGGKAWSHSTLTGVLTNTALVGYVRHHFKDGDEVVKKNWGPLVDEGIFWRVQERLTSRPEKRSIRKHHRRFPLTTVVCNYCHLPFYGDHHFQRSGGKITPERDVWNRYYKHKIEPLAPACRGRRVSADAMESAVVELLARERLNSAYEQRLRAEFEKAFGNITSKPSAEDIAELDRLREKAVRLFEQAEDMLDVAMAKELFQRVADLRQDIGRREQQVKRGELASSAFESSWEIVREHFQHTSTVLQKWQTADEYELQRALDSWILEIRVPPLAKRTRSQKIECWIDLRIIPDVPKLDLFSGQKVPKSRRKDAFKSVLMGDNDGAPGKRPFR